MSGSALLVLAALAASLLVSMLLWLARRLFRRRPKSFREQLAAVSDRPGAPVGPAGGVAVVEAVGRIRPQGSVDQSRRLPTTDQRRTTAGVDASTSKEG